MPLLPILIKIEQPRPPATQNPQMSYAYLRLMGRSQRQVAHPPRSRGFQTPGPSPLALSSETSADNEDATDAISVSESTASPNEALDAEESTHSEDNSDTTLINESTTATDGTGNSKSA